MQIAALNVRSEADAIAKRLSSKGYAAYVLAPASGTPSVFRVRVGKFPTRREAETDRRQAAEGRAVQALGHALIRSTRHVSRRRIASAAASGVLLALSFPKFGHPAFGWIALAPLLVALGGPRPIAHAPRVCCSA